MYKSIKFSQKTPKTAEVQYQFGLKYFFGIDGFPEDKGQAIQLLKNAAELGHIGAQVAFGEYLVSQGENYRKDSPKEAANYWQKAISWFEKAVMEENPEAQYHLGVMCLYGKGIPKNIQRAITLLTYSAEQQCTKSSSKLGELYCNGEYVTRDLIKGIEYFERAALLGCRVAFYNLGVFFSSLIPQSLEDEKHMFECYTNAAIQGEVNAQINLGEIYFKRGNIKEALFWYEKAASQGDQEARNKVAEYKKSKLTPEEARKMKVLYGISKQYIEQGKIIEAIQYATESLNMGYEESRQLAFQIRSAKINKVQTLMKGKKNKKFDDQHDPVKSSIEDGYKVTILEKGRTEADYALGMMYFKGEGAAVSKDFVLAIEYLKKVPISEGRSDAHLVLGRIFYNGEGGIVRSYKEAEKYFKMAAEQGEKEAQFELGIMYLTGYKEVNQNLSEALAWFIKAGVNGHREAEYQAGEIYNNGSEQIVSNKVLAIKWWSLAAKSDHPEAQYKLGEACFNGNGISQNQEKAIKLWERATCMAGHTASQYMLAEAYFSGNGVVQDKSKAFKYYSELAEKGHMLAQWKLGNIFYCGDGVKKSLFIAAKWIKLSAEQGYSEAQYKLGELYWCNKDLQNKVEAVKWFKMAAIKGHIGAKRILGKAYLTGEGVKNKNLSQAVVLFDEVIGSGHKVDGTISFQIAILFLRKVESNKGTKKESNIAELIRWLNIAAEQNCVDAQLKLGELHWYGVLIAKNQAEAIKWYEEAIKQEPNHLDAVCKLGQAYQKGIGVKQDNVKAMEYYTKAAPKDVEAQYCLGELLLKKEGMAQQSKLKEAIEWFKQAATNGHRKAMSRLLELLSNNTHDGDYQDLLSVELLQQASNQGYIKAHYVLGNKYSKGNGVREDWIKADECWTKAARCGLSDAEQQLIANKTMIAKAYYERGCEYNKQKIYKKYIECLLQAARGGHAKAQYELGKHYFIGRHVYKSFTMAKHFWQQADEQGNEQAKQQLVRINKYEATKAREAVAKAIEAAEVVKAVERVKMAEKVKKIEAAWVLQTSEVANNNFYVQDNTFPATNDDGQSTKEKVLQVVEQNDLTSMTVNTIRRHQKAAHTIMSINLMAHVPTEVVDLLTKLNEFGYLAYLVGGSVRDLLLSQNDVLSQKFNLFEPRQYNDFDVVTTLSSDSLLQKIVSDLYSSMPYPCKHKDQLFTVISKRTGNKIDIWLNPRLDGIGDGEISSMEEEDAYLGRDAENRDFTVNAIYVNNEGRIFDPTNRGLSELGRQELNFIRDPSYSIKSDPLRLLRLVELKVRLGLNIDTKLIPIIRSVITYNPSLMRNIPREVMCSKLNHMFFGGNAKQVYLTLNLLGITQELFSQNRNNVLYQDYLYVYWATEQFRLFDERILSSLLFSKKNFRVMQDYIDEVFAIFDVANLAYLLNQYPSQNEVNVLCTFNPCIWNYYPMDQSQTEKYKTLVLKLCKEYFNSSCCNSHMLDSRTFYGSGCRQAMFTPLYQVLNSGQHDLTSCMHYYYVPSVDHILEKSARETIKAGNLQTFASLLDRNPYLMDQLGKEWFLDVAAQFNQTEIVRWLCRRCFSGDDQQNYITNSNSGKRLLLNITEKYKNFSCFEEIAPYIYREAINLRLWNAVCLNCNIRTIKILLDKYLLSNRAEQYYIKVTSILQKVIDNLKDTKQQKLSGRGETHPQNIKYELQNVIDTLNIELRKVREKTRFCYKIF